MGTRNWRALLAVVSAVAALAATVLTVVAVFDAVGWTTVILAAVTAVVCAIPALLTSTGPEAESRRQ